MTLSSRAIVNEARSWIGTPFVHQAVAKGAGCDCLGFLRGVWRELTGDSTPFIFDYHAHWFEHDPKERLLEGLRSYLIEETGPLQNGQIILFRLFQKYPAQHVGIVTQSGPKAIRFIHAIAGHGVVEVSLSPRWQRRIVAQFRMKKV